MAQDGEPPKAVDKGKGKAEDGESSKPEEVKKDKDGKPIPNGKGKEDGIGGEGLTLRERISANTLCSSRRAQ
jgi:hypothetical protein